MYASLVIATQEAAAAAGANTERRLREEMERDREATRGKDGSVSALEGRMQEALSELSEQRATAADLKTRLEQVQVFAGINMRLLICEI